MLLLHTHGIVRFLRTPTQLQHRVHDVGSSDGQARRATKFQGLNPKLHQPAIHGVTLQQHLLTCSMQCSCKTRCMVIPSVPGRMLGVAEPDEVVSAFSRWSALNFLALRAFILLMMDSLLKVPRLRLMVMFCSRFIITGRLCWSCPVLNTLPLTLLT